MLEKLIPDGTDHEAQTVAPNYQYWRDHGAEWPDEYDARRQQLILYHIQELMLTEYVLNHAERSPHPLKVLEFGCGTGRHLENLRSLPGVEVFGYDQSETMAAGCLRWSGSEWFAAHVRVGSPTGQLPYLSGEFDLVYSAEVLVHVRPEDLEGILSELVRVCRGHILHLEPSRDVPIIGDAHYGCWRHDLPTSYARLGKRCEILPSGYRAHEPHRVIVQETPRFDWPPALLGLYRRLEHAMDLMRADAEQAQAAARSARLEGDSALAAGKVLQQVLEARLEMASTAAREAETRAAALTATVEELRTALVEGSARLATVTSKLNETTSHAARLRAERRDFIRRASRHLE